MPKKIKNLQKFFWKANCITPLCKTHNKPLKKLLKLYLINTKFLLKELIIFLN